jgi:hypothetical protein
MIQKKILKISYSSLMELTFYNLIKTKVIFGAPGILNNLYIFI